MHQKKLRKEIEDKREKLIEVIDEEAKLIVDKVVEASTELDDLIKVYYSECK